MTRKPNSSLAISHFENHLSFWKFRLSAQLLQTTWDQTALQCENDLNKMKEWSKKYAMFSSKQARSSNYPWILDKAYVYLLYINLCIYIYIHKNRQRSYKTSQHLLGLVNLSQFLLIANAQASMDYKWINDRFQKGKEAIQDHMAERMSFLRTSSLVLAHSDVVAAQAKLGSEGFLDWYISENSICIRNCCLGQPRLTILVGDFTLWPSRSLV